MPNKIQKKLNQLRQEKQLMTILVFFFLAVASWIIVDIFVLEKKHQVSSEMIKASQPLVPNLDQEVLSSIGEKRLFEDDELKEFSIFVLSELDSSGDYQVIDVVKGKKVQLMTQSDLSINLGELLLDEEVVEAEVEEGSSVSSDNSLDEEDTQIGLDSTANRESSLAEEEPVLEEQ